MLSARNFVFSILVFLPCVYCAVTNGAKEPQNLSPNVRLFSEQCTLGIDSYVPSTQIRDFLSCFDCEHCDFCADVFRTCLEKCGPRCPMGIDLNKCGEICNKCCYEAYNECLGSACPSSSVEPSLSPEPTSETVSHDFFGFFS